MLTPACATALGSAAAGAVVNHAGSCSASPKPRTVASTLQPCFSAAARDMSTRAAAPSEMVDALAAVTVPPFLKAGRPLEAGLGAVAGSSSMRTTTSPLRPLIVMGTTSPSKRPASCAARARAYDASECSSCISFVISCVSAHSSAYPPMWQLPYGSHSPSATCAARGRAAKRRSPGAGPPLVRAPSCRSSSRRPCARRSAPWGGGTARWTSTPCRPPRSRPPGPA